MIVNPLPMVSWTIIIVAIILTISIFIRVKANKKFNGSYIIGPIMFLTVGIGGLVLNYHLIEKPKEEAQKRVESNLKIILATDEASNNDRIVKHEKEYNAILKDGEYAFSYMLQVFSKSKSDSVKEWIMAKACSDIDKIDIIKNWSTGREWYNKYQKYLNEQPIKW